MTLRRYIGQRVYIEWRDPEHDWHWFRLLDVMTTGALWWRKTWLELQGLSSPTHGAPYTGGPIIVPLDDIALIETPRCIEPNEM